MLLASYYLVDLVRFLASYQALPVTPIFLCLYSFPVLEVCYIILKSINILLLTRRSRLSRHHSGCLQTRDNRRRLQVLDSSLCLGCLSCLPSCSLHLVRYLSMCLQTRDNRRRLQVLDSSLCVGLGYSRSCVRICRSLGCLLSFELFSLILLHSQLLCLSILLFYCRIAGTLVLGLSVAEPVTNVGTEITCTQTNTKGRKKPCKPILSRSGKEAGQSIGTEASSSTEQDVLDYLRINSRLLIQAHHLEICLFIHICLT